MFYFNFIHGIPQCSDKVLIACHVSSLMEIVFEWQPRAEMWRPLTNITFNHNSSRPSALILSFAMPLTVLMCLFLDVLHMGAAHPRVLLSGNGCGTVGVGGG